MGSHKKVRHQAVSLPASRTILAVHPPRQAGRFKCGGQKLHPQFFQLALVKQIGCEGRPGFCDNNLTNNEAGIFSQGNQFFHPNLAGRLGFVDG